VPTQGKIAGRGESSGWTWSMASPSPAGRGEQEPPGRLARCIAQAAPAPAAFPPAIDGQQGRAVQQEQRLIPPASAWQAKRQNTTARAGSLRGSTALL
jgi:hypothetical protein